MEEIRPMHVSLDTRVYRLEAIKRAGYKFADRFHVLISPEDNEKVVVYFRPKRGTEVPEQIVGEFTNEVLDQDLRLAVSAETEALRNLIVAQAFSNTSLLDPEAETSDYHADPLRLSTPDDPT